MLLRVGVGGLRVRQSRGLVARLGLLIVRERTHDERIALGIEYALALEAPTESDVGRARLRVGRRSHQSAAFGTKRGTTTR